MKSLLVDTETTFSDSREIPGRSLAVNTRPSLVPGHVRDADRETNSVLYTKLGNNN